LEPVVSDGGRKPFIDRIYRQTLSCEITRNKFQASFSRLARSTCCQRSDRVIPHWAALSVNDDCRSNRLSSKLVDSVSIGFLASTDATAQPLRAAIAFS